MDATTTPIEQAKVNEVMTAAPEMLDQVNAMLVTNPEEESTAAKIMLEAKRRARMIEEWFKPQIDLANETHKELCSKRSEAVKPYNDIGLAISGKIGGYRAVLRAQQEDAERKARLAADERARKDQKKLRDQAQKAEENGKTEKAEALRDQAETVASAPIPTAPRPGAVKTDSGTLSGRMKLQAEVRDMDVLVRAVADGKVPVGVLQVHLPSVKKWAEMNGTKSGTVHGIAFWQEEDFSARGVR